jgi:hypothetical protein
MAIGSWVAARCTIRHLRTCLRRRRGLCVNLVIVGLLCLGRNSGRRGLLTTPRRRFNLPATLREAAE